MTPKQLVTIGRAERISFPASKITNLPAKIDTGAYRSSVWATNIHKNGDTLYYTLLGPESSQYSGIEQSTKEFKVIEIENSFGHKEERYSIFLTIEIAGKKVKSNFTLANRGMKTYPALIGRKLLRNRFIVDVATGSPISDEEKADVDNLD